jgi:2'-5' RNA ligase
MHITLHTLFKLVEKPRQIAENLQRLEYKYETVEYVENLIRHGKL